VPHPKMQLFASLALLALLKPHPALAATVAANVKHITLDIVNAHVAPDGFSRCMLTMPRRTFLH
jgi:hypothetical protein